MIIQILLIAIGFVMLVKGADLFVEGSAGIAAKFGIPQLVIGLTIVAMGTSAPEAAVSITAALKGNAGITIGNIVGSNIMNILLILGVTATIITTAVSASTIRYEIPYMIFVTVLLLFLGFTGGSIGRIEGVVLWIAFILYLSYLFVMAKKNREEVDEENNKYSLPYLIFFVIVGIALIVFGSDISVDAATKLAIMIGIKDRIIGLTIVALGTSLPELCTSVAAARKGKADIAIGNIVGSNLFNILFVVGTTALITPVVFQSKFLIDTIVAMASGMLLLVCVLRKKSLNRLAGLIMLICYGGYFLYLMMMK